VIKISRSTRLLYIQLLLCYFNKCIPQPVSNMPYNKICHRPHTGLLNYSAV